MKIIFCLWGSMCESGMLKAIENLKYNCIQIKKENDDMDYDKPYFLKIVDTLKEHGDAACVLSFNYIPIVARACKPFNIHYISLTADCPCSTLYSKTLAYPTNRVFLFDSIQTAKFKPVNPDNIKYLPLACNTDMWDKAVPSIEDHKRFDCDVSFIGSLYSEVCKYNEIENKLDDYTKGYVEGLINAQLNVYGYNFLEDSITTEWATTFKKQAGLSDVAEDYNEDITGVIADLYLGYKCTEQERIHLLRAVSDNFSTDIYTLSDTSMLPNIHNRGPADSVTMMPKIFKCSKININTTNKAIQSGIPLRIFDIMGSGGFLITNYQSDLLELFTPDEDIVIYESIPDLLDKINFYLKNDSIRTTIARNGYEKVKKYHSYEQRLNTMLKESGII